MEILEVEQENLFENVITRGNFYLRSIGLKLDSKDEKRTFIQRLRFRRIFVFIFFLVNCDVSGQVTWLIGSFVNGESDLINISFLLPCLLVVMMGTLKAFYFFKNVHHIHEIINTLKKLKIERSRIANIKEDKFAKKCIRFLSIADKITMWTTILGLILFGAAPAVLTARTFYSTGEIKLFYPFLFYYPFNAYDIRVYPFLYIHQLWSAWIAVCLIWGPDYICYTVATLAIIQYYSLKQDIIHLLPKSRNSELHTANEGHFVKFREIVKRHNDLFRCAKLMEMTYTKTILINVVFSSTLICFNLFNITANDNIAVRGPCTAFLALVLGQIYILCYFGDIIMRSSMEVSDAVYECQWYGAKPATVKDLMIVALRSRKPCKLTAYGFSDVNLITFSKILSTSWSYFALLQTLHKKNKAEIYKE